MNVAFGGSLHGHLPDHPVLIEHGVPLEGTLTIHDVTPEPGSRLAAVTKVGSPPERVASSSGVDRLGEGLAVTGRSPGRPDRGDREDRARPAGHTSAVDGRSAMAPGGDRGKRPRRSSRSSTHSPCVRGSRAKPGDAEGKTRSYSIRPYDPGWPTRYEAEAERIRASLGDQAVRVEHVGSTSVPGLAAKPVIDIQVSVPSMMPRSSYRDPGRARLRGRSTHGPTSTSSSAGTKTESEPSTSTSAASAASGSVATSPSATGSGTTRRMRRRTSD